ncbi:hypothetical protein CF161_02321 [Pseudomonas sp. CF161]|nr:hypothetical protein CF161_02321 [Pseudomonas sp. CF161]
MKIIENVFYYRLAMLFLYHISICSFSAFNKIII